MLANSYPEIHAQIIFILIVICNFLKIANIVDEVMLAHKYEWDAWFPEIFSLFHVDFSQIWKKKILEMKKKLL